MKRFIRLLCIILALTLGVLAQTNTPSFTLNFNVLNGPAGTVGTDAGMTYAVTTNALLREDTIIIPAFNGVYFGGGLQYALPTCGILANTNLNCEKFQFYGTGSLGVSRVTIGNTPSVNHAGGMFGAGANYDPTGTGKFSINLFDFHMARLPGIASGLTPILSTGINLGWGSNQGAVVARAERKKAKERKRLEKAQRDAQKG